MTENWDELADAAELSEEGRQIAWTAMRDSALRDAKRDEKRDRLALIEDEKIPSSDWFKQSYFQQNGRVT